MLEKKTGSDVRTMGTLSWHIVVSVAEMMNLAGLAVDGPEKEDNRPSSIKEIADIYKRASESLITELESKWNDAGLTDMIPMYGREWSKGATLSILIRHQSHHRGQLTTLMRLAGLKVPGVYGPAKEEWAAMGMEAPAAY